ncbi:unnamed protein product [Peronospora destructor]|uniref:Uncharacterized protein n=1 Tax=Peronospora destructor TaxID=86335 RepID=A0AAV0T106_9STRA|nr:unnamed protein product [Peronospora destructor]
MTTRRHSSNMRPSSISLLLLFALQLAVCITGQRRMVDVGGVGEGQIVLYPAPFFIVDGLDFQGTSLAYLQEQGINTSIEAQTWMQQHGYTTLRAMLDDESLYEVINEAMFDCGLTSPTTETKAIPTNNTFLTSGYPLDGPCEIWLDDTKVVSGRNCHTEFPRGEHEFDYSTCGDLCTIYWYWLSIKYIEGIYSWQVYKNCIRLGTIPTA